MFHTITKLFDDDNGKYIYFGASIIYCDMNNACSIYYPDTSVVSVGSVGSVASVASFLPTAIVDPDTVTVSS
jgi:hypothetical protein